jgi:hypothetical protein
MPIFFYSPQFNEGNGEELGPLLLFNPHWANKSIFQQFSKIGINAFKLSPKGNQKNILKLFIATFILS